MKIEEIKQKYKNEWILVEILSENDDGAPDEVSLICHSRNRDDTYSAMKKNESKYLYHFYSGKIPKENYAVAF